MRRQLSRVVFIALLAIVGVVALLPQGKRIPLADGASAEVRRSGFLRALLPEAKTTINYTSPARQAGRLIIWQGPFAGPVLLIPAHRTNVFLCLYDYDVDYRLLRIDTSRPFRALLEGVTLRKILFASTWDIQEGDSADWEDLVAYLQQLSTHSFEQQSIPIPLRACGTPKSVLGRLAYQGIQPDRKGVSQ